MLDMSCHEELSLTHLSGAPLSSRAALHSLARDILFAKAVNSCYRFWSQIFILIRDVLVPCHFCYIYWYNKANVWEGVFLKCFASMRTADLALHHIKLPVKCIIRTGQNSGQSSCLASTARMTDGWHIPTVCEQLGSFQDEKLLISKSRISDLTSWVTDRNGCHLIFVPNIGLLSLPLINLRINGTGIVRSVLAVPDQHSFNGFWETEVFRAHSTSDVGSIDGFSWLQKELQFQNAAVGKGYCCIALLQHMGTAGHTAQLCIEITLKMLQVTLWCPVSANDQGREMLQSVPHRAIKKSWRIAPRLLCCSTSSTRPAVTICSQDSAGSCWSCPVTAPSQGPWMAVSVLPHMVLLSHSSDGHTLLGQVAGGSDVSMQGKVF